MTRSLPRGVLSKICWQTKFTETSVLQVQRGILSVVRSKEAVGREILGTDPLPVWLARATSMGDAMKAQAFVKWAIFPFLCTSPSYASKRCTPKKPIVFKPQF